MVDATDLKSVDRKVVRVQIPPSVPFFLDTPSNLCMIEGIMKQGFINRPQMLNIKVPVSQCIDEVLDYLLYSEMEGEVDETDPWHPTYQSLLELKEKVLDEEEMS